MSLYRKIFTAMIAACFVTTVVACKQADPELTKTEELIFPTDVAVMETSLNHRLDEFEKLLDSGELSKVLDFTPPKVLNKILSGANVTRAELDRQMDQMWKQVLVTVEINGFDLDRNSKDIMFLDNGRPYKTLPTSSTMTIKANRSEVVTRSETLAFIENDEWYIVRLDDPAQVKIFRDAYPDFDDIQVMDPIMTMDGEEITP